jgi:hypothetical protein
MASGLTQSGFSRALAAVMTGLPGTARTFDGLESAILPLRLMELRKQEASAMAAAQDDRAATGVSRQVRGHIDSQKTHFAVAASDFFIFPWAVRSKWRGVGVGRTKHLYRAARSM